MSVVRFKDQAAKWADHSPLLDEPEPEPEEVGAFVGAFVAAHLHK